MKTSNSVKALTPQYTKISWCTVCNTLIVGRWAKSCSQRCIRELLSQAGRQSGRRSAAARIVRSKDEIKLYEYVVQQFPNAQHNQAIFNGWDADIILPTHKIAILWNGPWHYREMGFGTHSLLQVKTRDAIKQREIIKEGWQCMIFEDRYYTPKLAFEVIRKRVLELHQDKALDVSGL